MIRGILIATTIFVIWEISCLFFELPAFMLPPPSKVFVSIYANWDELLVHASYTLVEILASIAIGSLIGITTALIISSSVTLKIWIILFKCMSM